MEPKPSTRGQRRRTKAKRLKAMNPPKYPVGTILYREVIADKDMILSNGSLVKKGGKYMQSYAQLKQE